MGVGEVGREVRGDEGYEGEGGSGCEDGEDGPEEEEEEVGKVGDKTEGGRGKWVMFEGERDRGLRIGLGGLDGLGDRQMQ